MTTYGSVCSGIESASVAWEPLGYQPQWFSEIEPFPCAVLTHHWPHVPNLGDMLQLPGLIRSGMVSAPDVLVGGTPCQAFSVAGARRGMADERGQLTMTYVEILNEIDKQRPGREAVCVWENVPGVLSSKDNAFGCFLGALCGEDGELEPPGGRWRNAGAVFGPQRAIAWRVLDAQYFGVAQRRRRVFLVASARDGFDPCAVLFESEGVRRDTPPSREPGQSTTHDVAGSLTASGRGVERPGDSRGQDPVVAVPILEPGARTGKSTTDLRAGVGVGDAGDPMFTLQAGKQHGVFAFGQNRTSGPVDVSHVLRAKGGSGPGDFESETFCLAFKPSHFTLGKDGSPRNIYPPLTADADKGDQDPVVLAFSATFSNGSVGDDVAPTMGAHNNGTNGPAIATSGPAVRRLMPVECERLQGFPDGHTQVPYRNKPTAAGPRYKAIGNSKAVPCIRWIGERLQRELELLP